MMLLKIKNLKLIMLFTIALLIILPKNIFANLLVDSTHKEKSKKSTKVLYGTASFYSDYFNGRQTSNGEIFSQKKLTCACNVLPLGTWIKVTNLKNSKSIVVKTNDRLHPKMTRIVDLTRLGAEKLDFINAGLTRVKVEIIGKKPPKS